MNVDNLWITFTLRSWKISYNIVSLGMIKRYENRMLLIINTLEKWVLIINELHITKNNIQNSFGSIISLSYL
jgi:hypothetical protein